MSVGFVKQKGDTMDERANAEWNDSLTQGQRMVGACREYAAIVGADCPQRAWISTNYDTFVRNPYYSGPPVPHPEDACDDSPDDCHGIETDMVPERPADFDDDPPF